MENISVEQRQRMTYLMREMRKVAERVGPLHSWWDLIAYFDLVLSGGKFFSGLDSVSDMISEAQGYFVEAGLPVPYEGEGQLQTFEELNAAVIKWGRDREIVQNGKVTTQLIKTMEELGELAGNVVRGKCIKDDLGDVLVTLILVAEMSGTSMLDVLAHAYGEIKDRKGRLTEEGVFIKEEDEYPGG